MSMAGSFALPAATILITSRTLWIKHSPTPDDQQSCYVGLRITPRITPHRETREFFLDHIHYLTRLVQKFGFRDFVPLFVLANPHIHLSTPSFDNCNPDPSFPYHTIVRSLQFAYIGTRPNLSYTINVAPKFCANSSPTHCNALRRILKYLVGTLSFGIFLFWK